MEAEANSEMAYSLLSLIVIYFEFTIILNLEDWNANSLWEMVIFVWNHNPSVWT